MNVINKIRRSWWVIFSAVFMMNGFGFIYIGLKSNNKNWVLEGIAYEIPWIFSLIYADTDYLLDIYIVISLILMLVSIVRSVWVAIKLGDVYDNEDKYLVQTTRLDNPNKPSENNGFPTSTACCTCVILIFVVFAITGIL